MKRNYILSSTSAAQQFFLVAVMQQNFRNPVSKSNKAQDNFRNCGGCALRNKLRSAQLWF